MLLVQEHPFRDFGGICRKLREELPAASCSHTDWARSLGAEGTTDKCRALQGTRHFAACAPHPPSHLIREVLLALLCGKGN